MGLLILSSTNRRQDKVVKAAEGKDFYFSRFFIQNESDERREGEEISKALINYKLKLNFESFFCPFQCKF